MELESAKILGEKGIEYKLIELREMALSVEDVVKYAKEDVNREEICKTIIVKDRKGNYHGFLLLGGQRIDFSKLKQVIGGKASVADPIDMGDIAGVEPGMCAPCY